MKELIQAGFYCSQLLQYQPARKMLSWRFSSERKQSILEKQNSLGAKQISTGASTFKTVSKIITKYGLSLGKKRCEILFHQILEWTEQGVQAAQCENYSFLQ